MVREFRLPEGVSAEDMDSNGDGDLLVALDLRSDDSLALGRVARELVNRVQKLRKVAPCMHGVICRLLRCLVDSVPQARKVLAGAVLEGLPGAQLSR